MDGRGVREQAPFQFFSDHIDEEIAIATRLGRLEDLAGFAATDLPDPQDPATFERSKLGPLTGAALR